MISFRPITSQDVPTVYAFRLDDEVMYWASGGYADAVPTLPQLEGQVQSQRSTDANRMFVIEVLEEEEPVVIGTVSFRGLDRISRRATISILIGDKRYWGRGYGAAVIRRFVAFLFTRYNLHRIDLDTFAGNERAIRCYQKCGFVVEGVLRRAMWTTDGYRDQIMMGLLREDWEAANLATGEPVVE